MNSIALQQLTSFCLAWLLFGPSCYVLGQEIRFWNDWGDYVELWQYVARDWDRPPARLPKNQYHTVSLGRPGPYYLLLRDGYNRDHPAGWLRLHDVYERDPNAIISLSKLLRYEQKEEPYVVMTPHGPEQGVRTRTIPIAELRCYIYSRGRWHAWDEFTQPKVAPQ